MRSEERGKEWCRSSESKREQRTAKDDRSTVGSTLLQAEKERKQTAGSRRGEEGRGGAIHPRTGDELEGTARGTVCLHEIRSEQLTESRLSWS